MASTPRMYSRSRGAGGRNADCQAAIARYRTEAADHAHALAGGAPILARDMYEHAYHLFVGARTAACVDAVMDNLHWERIAARYCRERHNETKDIALFTPFGVPLDAEQVITAEELRATVERDPPVILDVCLNDDLPRRTDMLPGAAIRNSAAIDRWAETLPHDKPIVVYCLSVFRSAAMQWPSCGAAATTR